MARKPGGPAGRAKTLFRKHGGLLRTSQALALRIHPRTFYSLRDAGEIERLERGLYTLPDAVEAPDPDLLIIASRVPKAVVCLLSALAFHEITTQLPYQIHIALPRGTKTPKLAHPPLRVYRFSGDALTQGIETHRIDGVALRVYFPAKTVADCFKFRNKIGFDVALEALRDCWQKKLCTMDDLWKYARVCRVANVMRPYLESLV